MATDGFQRVLDSFDGDPTFMGKSGRAQKASQAINASPEAQALLAQGFSQSYAERVAKAVK